MIKLQFLLKEHPDKICLPKSETGAGEDLCCVPGNPYCVSAVCAIYSINSKNVWFSYVLKQQKILSNVKEYQDKISNYIDSEKEYEYNSQALTISEGNPIVHSQLRYIINSTFRLGGEIVLTEKSRLSHSRLYNIKDTFILTFWENKNEVLGLNQSIKDMVNGMGYDPKKILYEVADYDGDFFSYEELFENKTTNKQRTKVDDKTIELRKQLHLNPLIKKALLKMSPNRLQLAADKLNMPVIKLKQLLGRDISESFINEAPIDTLQTIGDFSKGSSFTNKTDRALITHPVAVQKIKDFFKNSDTNFDFYFVNTKEARKYTEVGEVKEDFIYDKLKINPEQLKDGKINTDNITVFFTNNKGDERMPFTAWTIAHRFSHVARRTYGFEEYSKWLNSILNQILKSYGVQEHVYQGWTRYGDMGNYKQAQKYNLAKKYICQELGVFKSARDKNLRNYQEFFHECMAYYLKTGLIKFNHLPDTLTLGYEAFGRKRYYRVKDKELLEDSLTDLQRDFSYYANDVLNDCTGKIFVM